MSLSVSLAEKGAYLACGLNTPMAELVNATYENQNFYSLFLKDDSLDNDGSMSDFATNIEYITTGLNTLKTRHDLVVDDLVDLLSKSVSGHLSMIKNSIIPTIDHIYDDVTKILESDLNKNPADKFNIEVLDIPDFLNEPFVSGLVSQYNDMEVVVPIVPKGKIIDVITAEKISDGMAESLNGIVGSLSDYAKTLGTNYIHKLLINITQVTDLLGGEERVQKIIKAADAYLILKYINSNDDIADEIFGGGGYETNAYLTSAIKYCLATIASNKYLIDNYSRDTVNDLIILSIDQDKKTAKVNGGRYRKWLVNGGSPDAIYGMIVNDDLSLSSFSTMTLDANKDKLIYLWNEYVRLNMAANEITFLSKFKQVFTSVFFQDLNKNASDIEKDFFLKNNAAFSTIKKIFLKEIEEVYLKDVKEIYNTCSNIVCRSRFYYTDAEKILNFMLDEVKNNSDLDPRSAATLAAIFYVSDYLSDQFKAVY